VRAVAVALVRAERTGDQVLDLERIAFDRRGGDHDHGRLSGTNDGGCAFRAAAIAIIVVTYLLITLRDTPESLACHRSINQRRRRSATPTARSRTLAAARRIRFLEQVHLDSVDGELFLCTRSLRVSGLGMTLLEAIQAHQAVARRLHDGGL